MFNIKMKEDELFIYKVSTAIGVLLGFLLGFVVSDKADQYEESLLILEDEDESPSKED